MEKIYFKILTRERLTDKELKQACWDTIENSKKICSVKARRTIEELNDGNCVDCESGGKE